MQKSTPNNFFAQFSFGASSKSRPGTASGDPAGGAIDPRQPLPPGLAAATPPLPSLSPMQQTLPAPLSPGTVPGRERKSSYSRKASFSGPVGLSSSPSRSQKKRANSSSASSIVQPAIMTDSSAPPALPDFALATARLAEATSSPPPPPSAASPDSGLPRLGPKTPTASTSGSIAASLAQTNANPMPSLAGDSSAYQALMATVSKRINTLDYLRKAHEGKMFWFNTYLIDQSESSTRAMAQKLTRRATNFVQLGVSLPLVIDMYSSSPLEFLRSLNSLLGEFDSFQQFHGDSSGAMSSISRAARMPMFRRPGGRSRRSTTTSNDYGDDAGSGGLAHTASASAASFAPAEADLHPSETYQLLLTPSLPFDTDFHQTFATLCDVLIDCYKNFVALVPSPRDCTPPVTDQFAKVDARVRKLVIQHTVKELEDSTRQQVKSELMGLGKVVLGGLI